MEEKLEQPIKYLIAILKCKGEFILEGAAKLSLPVCLLQMVNATLQRLDNYSSSLINNDDETVNLIYECSMKDVIYLQEFISKTPKLKLSQLKGPLPTEVDITRFVNLRYIELVHVNIKNVKGLQALRPQLEFLDCSYSGESFEEVLAGDSCSLQVWEELRTVDFSHNKIEMVGARTFISTPWIQYLDLSSNNISSVNESLECLNNLKYLNLSYNHLDTLPFLSQEACKKLETLLLTHNFIEDITGIWLFTNINTLDVSYNLLDDHSNITSLTELNKLQWLSLIGNPLSYHRYHRTYTSACLSKSIPVQSIVLDNQKLNAKEKKVIGTRGGRIVYSSPLRNPNNSRSTSVSRRCRTVSSTSSTNSYNTVISANIKPQSSSSELKCDSKSLTVSGGTKFDSNGASSSGTGSQNIQSTPILSKSVSSSGRRMPKIREAVIVDIDAPAELPSPVPPVEGSGSEHLETKKQMEGLRQRFGEDHWLHSHAGSFVQDLLGLQKTPCPTSVLADMTRPLIILEEEEKQQSILSPVKSEIPKSFQEKTVDKNNVESEDNSRNNNSNVAVNDNSTVIPEDQQSKEAEKHALTSPGNESFDLKNTSDAIPDSSIGEFYSCDDLEESNDNSTLNETIENDNFVETNVGGDDDEEEEDDDGDESSHPWLVQKVSQGKVEEVFLVLKEKELLEKDSISGRTLVRWGLSTVQSCVKVGAQPPTVQVTFDTVRRTCQERTYIMEQDDSQVLLQQLSQVLESRPLSAMNQTLFKCMKCNTLFSREFKASILNPDGSYGTISCDVCRSTLVVKVDENEDGEHLPSLNARNLATITNTNSSTTGNSSSITNSLVNNYNNLISSITNTISSNINNNNNTNNNIITSNTTSSVTISNNQPKLSASPSQCSIGSAASLEQSSSRESPAAGLGDTIVITSSSAYSVKYDSDIEIISNPSQSSIEVLEEHVRLQGTNTPNRKRSSEERQTVAVPQLMTVPEVINTSTTTNTNTSSSNTPALLTESSSSGSLTDSICTAYENHPPLSSTRRLPSQGSVIDKFIEETSADNSPDFKNTNTTSMSVQQIPSANTDYSSVLQGATLKLDLLDGNIPISADVAVECFDTNGNNGDASIEDEDDGDMVHYNYEDFSQVDHRIKMFLYQQLFKNDDEHLVLLVRGEVVDKNNVFYPGCLVISTHSCFLLKVVNTEHGDDASNFLVKIFAAPLSKIQLSSISWSQGVKICNDNNTYLLILHDAQRTSKFFEFLSNAKDVAPLLSHYQPIGDGDKCEEFSSCNKKLQNVLSDDPSIKDNQNICTLSITCSTTVKRDNEKDVILPLACICNTSSDLIILTPNYDWLYKEEDLPVMYTVHNIINLIDVSVTGAELALHFLDESAGIEESWIFTFTTSSAIDYIINSIKQPWETIFSVPLQVTEYNNK